MLAVLALSGCWLDDPHDPDPDRGLVDPFRADRLTTTLGPWPPDEPLSDRERERLRLDYADGRWEWVASSFPDAVRPEDPFEGYVAEEEFLLVFYECLVASGVRATLDPGGGIGWETDSAADAVATYTCEMRSPAEPVAPLSDRQVGYIYDYQVRIQAPCLRGLGYDVPPAPPRAEFVEDWPLVDWSAGGAPPSGALFERSSELCPPLAW